MIGLQLSPFMKQYLIVIAANLNMISCGIALGWTSPMLVKLQDEIEFPLSRPLTQEEGSWVVSIAFALGMCMFFMPAVINLLGRKYTILSAFIPNFIANVLFVFGKSFWTVLVARALCGVAMNILFNSIAIYSSEIANKEIRGILGTFLQIFCGLGYLIIVAIGPYLTYSACNLLCAVIMALAALPSLFLPETPYSLFTEGKRDEALKLLSSLRGSKSLAHEEIATYTIEEQLQTTKPKIFTRNFMKATILVNILGTFGLMSGHNSLSHYLQTICIATKTSISPELATAVVASVGFVSSCCAVFFIDRVGRKPLLNTTAIGVAAGMFGLGTFFFYKEHDYEISAFMNIVPLVSMILVVVTYSIGFASIFFQLIPELYDGPGRATGVAIGNVWASVIIFANAKCFPLMVEELGPAFTFWSFGVVCTVKCIYVVLFFPETKSKSFLEIQESFGAKTHGSVTKC